jgi:alkylhydroperoxidase family enzyme
MGILPLARAPAQLAKTKVAVGYERTHATGLGERQRLAVVGLAAVGVEPVGMGRDITEQVQSMSREARVTRREFERTVGQTLRLVERADDQAGATT